MRIFSLQNLLMTVSWCSRTSKKGLLAIRKLSWIRWVAGSDRPSSSSEAVWREGRNVSETSVVIFRAQDSVVDCVPQKIRNFFVLVGATGGSVILFILVNSSLPKCVTWRRRMSGTSGTNRQKSHEKLHETLWTKSVWTPGVAQLVWSF